MDRLAKFAHFFVIPSDDTIAQVENTLCIEVFILQGLPKTIVSDRDRQFLGSFW